MITPKNRREIERNLYMLGEEVYENPYFVSPGHIEKLMAMRVLPNRRINLMSFDESIRHLANTLYSMQFLKPLNPTNNANEKRL